MILQLKIKNYRSYKEETVFSMIANNSSYKLDNVFELKNGKQEFRLLKSAIVYGANASGKSNVIRALFEITHLILNKPKIDENLRIYEPFLFDVVSRNKPSEFELTFIGPKEIKYVYKVIIKENIVEEEELYYYPNGKIAKLFSREPYNESTHIQKGKLGDSFGKKEINMFANQLLLSKFGDDEPNELLTEVFLYFKTYEILNATNPNHKEFLVGNLTNYLYENSKLKSKLAKLIKGADTKVNDIIIVRDQEKISDTINKSMYSVFGLHDIYKDESVVNSHNLPLKEESIGTQSLYVLGGRVLRSIENGGVLVVDELDTSLHPFITKMIVMLFQSEITNPKKAQLIFTTHDVSLLDRELIRRDQVWIADKNEKGATELYSLQDFEGLREDTPFEKWYLAGKFGGLPKIKSIESLFEENESTVS